MTSAHPVKSALPQLCGDFCLIPLWERQEWRDAGARYMVGLARGENGKPMPAWKIDEQLQPARLYFQLLFDAGVHDLSAIVAGYTLTTEPRPSYARTQ